ncbi:unnamed protein product [marine sediment metagenome]|uniref:Uncharacterized protein n=1 Tax=marine sediment metagenome TaxID=412755 RepID=X1F2Y8_9ZZZZ
MGYYIEVPRNKGKAQQIVELYGGRITPSPPSFEDITPEEAIICVVDNGPFEAAGLAFNQEELNVFSHMDGRLRTWVIMNRQKAYELTGYEES